jgi:small subunit ribosomal protein S4
MGRYTGPVERLSRREGVDLELKGERAMRGKSALERRGPGPPGQRSGARRRPRESVYGRQLREKQRAKRYYGVRERQFRRYIEAAARQREGRVGEQLLVLLESRLDNVVYRLGLASTRAQARQFITHGHVEVDRRRVDIPSYLVRPGQVVAIEGGSPVAPAVTAATELMTVVAPWLEVDFDRHWGRMLRQPERHEIAVPIDEQLIVEFYAR